MIKNLKIEIISSVQLFLETMSCLLAEKEAEYSLLLGLCEMKKLNPDDPDRLLPIVVSKNDIVIGGGILTKRNLVLTALEEAVLVKLAEFVKNEGFNFEGVVGPSMSSDIFARSFSKLTEFGYQLAMGLKIYVLTQTTPRKNTEGKLCLATIEHRELIGRWLFEFCVESLPNEAKTFEKNLELADLRIKKKEVFIWVTSDNKPVSMNLIGRPTQNGISISGVYTPKLFRKNGYASAVVAATSQKMLENGKKFCVLYTDVANPTSNKIYQAIGYKEVATSKHFIFKLKLPAACASLKN